MESRSRRSSGPSSDTPRIATCRAGTPGTVRHFMATVVRRGKPPVPKEQRDVWLGHDEKRTANACEAFDPEYLRVGAFAPFVRPTPQSDSWRRDRGRIVS